MLRVMLAAMAVWLSAVASCAAAEPPPLEAYGRLPAMEKVSLSPSGERYALVTDIDGQRRLFVADATKNEALYGLTLGAMKILEVQWAGDDHLVIIYSATVDMEIGFKLPRSELRGAVAVNVKTRKLTPVFDRKQSRVANTIRGYLGSAQIDGRWYGYFGGYTYSDHGRVKTDNSGRLYADLYKVDLDTGQMTMAAESQPNTHDWLVSPTGEVAARLEYSFQNGKWTIRGAKWSGSLLGQGTTLMGGISLLSFGRTTETILIAVEEESRDTIREVALADGHTVATFDLNVEGSPLTDDQTRLWIGFWRAERGKGFDLFAPERQRRVAAALKAFPGLIATPVSFNEDCSRIIVKTEGREDSGTYWLVTFDGPKGAAAPIGRPYPKIGDAFVGPVDWFTYKAADGLSLRGALTLPPNSMRKGLPLVVLPHGGPGAHDDLGFDYVAQAFASRGYAVLQPNFRGSTGVAKAFEDAANGEWGRKMQTDVSDGVAELARQGLIDPKRVCIVGASYGGYAALAGVTVQQGLYRCAVSVGGVADISTMLNYIAKATGAVSPAVRRWRAYMPSGEGASIDSISPARLADRADAPILLIHGKDDTVVPISQSQRMERALRGSGKSVELVTLPGADHWLLQEDSRIAMLKAAVAFVMKHNPPDAAPTH